MAKCQRLVGLFILLALFGALNNPSHTALARISAQPPSGGATRAHTTVSRIAGYQAFGCPENTQAPNCGNNAYYGMEIYDGGAARTGTQTYMWLTSPTVTFRLDPESGISFLPLVDSQARSLVVNGRGGRYIHDPGDPNTFVVQTHSLSIDVVDTLFTVEMDEAGTGYVAVPHNGGSVKITLKTGATIQITSDQQIYIPQAATAFPAVQPISPEEQKNWEQMLEEMKTLPGADFQFFPQTGHWMRGAMWKYWQEHGGLDQQGYPISEESIEPDRLNPGQLHSTQYFERAVFEQHPENAGTPYEILLAQLGTYRYKARYGESGEDAPPQTANQTPGQSQFFPETSHWVGGRFLQYWQQHGGLTQFGYPISDEFVEKSDLDSGKSYTVQYFERAVFEYHPENPAGQFDVLLAQLGTYSMHNK